MPSIQTGRPPKSNTIQPAAYISRSSSSISTPSSPSMLPTCCAMNYHLLACAHERPWGIVGICGLGHYTVLFAKSLGMEARAFTHSPNRMEDAKKLGADHVVDTNDKVRFTSHLARSARCLDSPRVRRASPSPSSENSISSSPRWTPHPRSRSKSSSPCSTCTAD